MNEWPNVDMLLSVGFSNPWVLILKTFILITFEILTSAGFIFGSKVVDVQIIKEQNWLLSNGEDSTGECLGGSGEEKGSEDIKVLTRDWLT